nr:MAG TPA: hypothetical protein [Caudoviricetes sp.]
MIYYWYSNLKRSPIKWQTIYLIFVSYDKRAKFYGESFMNAFKGSL